MHAESRLYPGFHTTPITPPSVYSLICLYLLNVWSDLIYFWYVEEY